MSARTPALLVRGAGRLADPSPSSLLIVDGRIRATGVDADDQAPGDARRLDAAGVLIAPGYIDLQVNGAGGHDLTAEPARLADVAASLPRYGVTAFLPTIVSAPAEVPAVAQAALAAYQARPHRGPAATPLGLHIEGPFISPDRPGVHDPEVLRIPDLVATADWSPATGIRLVTLAPELPRALELTRALVARGVVVSAGHTAAGYEEGRRAIEAGIRYATHLFNAMPPLDHRVPGIVLALLADPRVTLGLIPDGIHVHPALIELVWRLAGPDRVSAVTDAIAALGMPPGRFPLGRAEAEVADSEARVGGRLAGSVLGLDAAVRNLRAFAGAGPSAAVSAVTSVPARLLGLGYRGHLEPGAMGDLTLLGPDLEVAATIIAGQVAFAREGLGWA